MLCKRIFNASAKDIDKGCLRISCWLTLVDAVVIVNVPHARRPFHLQAQTIVRQSLF